MVQDPIWAMNKLYDIPYVNSECQSSHNSHSDAVGSWTSPQTCTLERRKGPWRDPGFWMRIISPGGTKSIRRKGNGRNCNNTTVVNEISCNESLDIIENTKVKPLSVNDFSLFSSPNKLKVPSPTVDKKFKNSSDFRLARSPLASLQRKLRRNSTSTAPFSPGSSLSPNEKYEDWLHPTIYPKDTHEDESNFKTPRPKYFRSKSPTRNPVLLISPPDFLPGQPVEKRKYTTVSSSRLLTPTRYSITPTSSPTKKFINQDTSDCSSFEDFCIRSRSLPRDVKCKKSFTQFSSPTLRRSTISRLRQDSPPWWLRVLSPTGVTKKIFPEKHALPDVIIEWVCFFNLIWLIYSNSYIIMHVLC